MESVNTRPVTHHVETPHINAAPVYARKDNPHQCQGNPMQRRQKKRSVGPIAGQNERHPALQRSTTPATKTTQQTHQPFLPTRLHSPRSHRCTWSVSERRFASCKILHSTGNKSPPLYKPLAVNFQSIPWMQADAENDYPTREKISISIASERTSSPSRSHDFLASKPRLKLPPSNADQSPSTIEMTTNERQHFTKTKRLKVKNGDLAS